MTAPRVAVVMGAGAGLGASLCRALTGEGWIVGALCRHPVSGWAGDPGWCAPGGKLIPLACDVTQAESIDRAVSALELAAGNVSALVYNSAALTRGAFLDLTLEQFEDSWRTMARGAFLSAQRVLPHMLQTQSGALLFSGATASIRGGSGFAAFASAKFALRGLAQSLAREFGPQGIHVAHIVIDGMIWSEQTRARFHPAQESCLDPETIAKAYCHLIAQHPSAWTHEMDLRPSMEKF